MLSNPEWKNDVMPEVMDGKNIADFIDPDIAEKLEALEREEERLEAEGFYEEDEAIVRASACVVMVALICVRSSTRTTNVKLSRPAQILGIRRYRRPTRRTSRTMHDSRERLACARSAR
jgi:hypothetical protein